MTFNINRFLEGSLSVILNKIGENHENYTFDIRIKYVI